MPKVLELDWWKPSNFKTENGLKLNYWGKTPFQAILKKHLDYTRNTICFKNLESCLAYYKNRNLTLLVAEYGLIESFPLQQFAKKLVLSIL